MAVHRDIPEARAVGGVDRPDGERAGLLTRTAVVFDRVESKALAECACCRKTMGRADRSVVCAACRRHQWIYRAAIAAGFVGCMWIGMQVDRVAFSVAPFAGRWVHAALAFGAALVAPLVFAFAANLARSEPSHGHWGRAVCFGRGRTVFRRADYGRALAAYLGREESAREHREPRTGWAVLAVFLVLVPAACAALATHRFPDTRFALYVDNGTDRDVVVDVVGRGEVARVPAGRAARVDLPHTAMTLRATAGGETVEEVTVGGLDEILAGRYPALFPDLEHDTGDVFIWNVQRRNCYESDYKTYGSIGGIGGAPTRHTEKVFVSPADVPFELAPGMVTSSISFDVRAELVRVPCR